MSTTNEVENMYTGGEVEGLGNLIEKLGNTVAPQLQEQPSTPNPTPSSSSLDDIEGFSAVDMEKKMVQEARMEELQEVRLREAKEIEKEQKKAQMRAEKELTVENRKEVNKVMKEEAVRAKEEAEKIKKLTETKEKKDLSTKIKKYMEAFPYLSSVVPRISERSTVAEMNEVLAMIRETLNTRNSRQNLMAKFTTGADILENVVGDGKWMTFVPPKARLNLTGLGQACKSGMFNKEVVPLLTEIDIEYPWLGGSGLFQRGLQTFLTILLYTHMVNTNPNMVKISNLSQAAPVNLDDDDIKDI